PCCSCCRFFDKTAHACRVAALRGDAMCLSQLTKPASPGSGTSASGQHAHGGVLPGADHAFVIGVATAPAAVGVLRVVDQVGDVAVDPPQLADLGDGEPAFAQFGVSGVKTLG